MLFVALAERVGTAQPSPLPCQRNKAALASKGHLGSILGLDPNPGARSLSHCFPEPP